MRQLDVDGRLATSWPTFKMMHGYFGTCVSGHKAFAFPSPEPCTRVCGIGCLAYYLPRHCGQLRAGLMMEQYAWARRQQDLFGEYAGIVVASEHMRRAWKIDDPGGGAWLARDLVSRIPRVWKERRPVSRATLARWRALRSRPAAYELPRLPAESLPGR